MKTALQTIIDQLKEDKEVAYYAIEQNTIQDCINILESYLEKEKQQIIEAHSAGVWDCKKHEDYYNEQLNQPLKGI